MTGTKLGFLSAASTQRASTALARTGTRAIDDAILAQVAAVAVAIGSGVNRGRTTHFIIDLSFLVALDRRVQFIDGAHTLAHREARAASCHGGFFGDPESALSARAAWSVLPSAQPGPDLILHTRDSASTEALTLRLCFEAKNPRRAKALADELADHVAVWDAAAASLRDTMERIRALIFETWLPKSRGASAHYRSACIYSGWELDPHALAKPLWEAPGHGGTDMFLVDGASANILAKHCTELWYATLKAHPKGQFGCAVCPGTDDLAASTDAADDFVPADRFMALWFGSGSAKTIE